MESDSSTDDRGIFSEDAHEWARIFLAVHFLEIPGVHPVARIWAEQLGLDQSCFEEFAGDCDLEHRGRQIAEIFFDGRDCPALSVRRLVPDWVAEETDLSPELLEYLQRRPPVWLRAQIEDVDELIRELQTEEIYAKQHPLVDRALNAGRLRKNFSCMNSFREGKFEVQDLASQCIALVCAPRPGERWWDACAGAGGKTLHIADLMKGKGVIVASDIRVHALRELRRRARRAGFRNIHCRKWEGESPQLTADSKVYDGVLVDAPCSCSGSWRRNPDARWRTQHDEIDEYCRLQKRLLHNAAAAVRDSGKLCYATCSLFDRENLRVVQEFLAENREFKLLPFVNPVSRQPGDGTAEIHPWDGDCEGMFVALMSREPGRRDAR